MAPEAPNSTRATGQDPAPPDLLGFLRALADPARLRIAGLLAAAPCTAAEAARQAACPLAAAMRHLALLAEAGLVRTEGSGQDARYHLDEDHLRHLAARALDSPRTRALAGATDERSRTLAAFFRDGRLLKFPSGERRRLVVLDAIAGRFDAERAYSEREVNDILRPLHEDYATIRRMPVDYGYLERPGGIYRVLGR
ncbi:MAG: DUF2087 domain-containing protein [Dehalococcoidia bacterium]